MAGIPDDYNTVPERIAEFRTKHPEGSLQPVNPAEPFQVVTIGNLTFIAYAAAAYRTPDDPRPGIGVAYEPFPGPTAFTRNSELQNAETSAWGRAIVAAGAADAKKGVATAEDIAVRLAERDPAHQLKAPRPTRQKPKPATTDGPSPEQTRHAMALFGELGITDRDNRLYVTSQIVGRDVDSWKAVTAAEARTVIDQLRKRTDAHGVGPVDHLDDESEPAVDSLWDPEP